MEKGERIKQEEKWKMRYHPRLTNFRHGSRANLSFPIIPGHVSLILFEPIERLSGPRAAISNHLSPRNNLKRFVVGNLI